MERNSHFPDGLILILILALWQAACMREYGKPISTPSPDGMRVIDVTQEVQPANDPDVYWQHISLRASQTAKPVIPGNVGVFSSRRAPTIVWKSLNEVAVMINRSDGGINFEMPPKEKVVDGVTVKFYVWKK